MAIKTNPNDSTRAGHRASRVIRVADRYLVYAIHTRGDDVEWVVTDTRQVDPLTDTPAVIRQGTTWQSVVAALPTE